MKRTGIFLTIMMAGAMFASGQGMTGQANNSDAYQALKQSNQKPLQRGTKINATKMQPVQTGTQQANPVRVQGPLSSKKLTPGKPLSQRNWQAAQGRANSNANVKPGATLSNVKPADQTAALRQSNMQPLQQGAKITNTKASQLKTAGQK